MTELHWNIGWTLATLGLGWLVLSCAVALALGQILRRGKGEESSAAAAQPVPAQQFNLLNATFESDEAASLDELPELQTGSRQASGTRLRPVVLDQGGAQPARKVS